MWKFCAWVLRAIVLYRTHKLISFVPCSHFLTFHFPVNITESLKCRNGYTVRLGSNDYFELGEHYFLCSRRNFFLEIFLGHASYLVLCPSNLKSAILYDFEWAEWSPNNIDTFGRNLFLRNYMDISSAGPKSYWFLRTIVFLSEFRDSHHSKGPKPWRNSPSYGRQ